MASSTWSGVQWRLNSPVLGSLGSSLARAKWRLHWILDLLLSTVLATQLGVADKPGEQLQGGQLPLSPAYLSSRARRLRHLAGKAKALADNSPTDPVSPRLMEMAEKLTLDAEQDEREAQALLDDQAGSDKGQSTPPEQ